MIDKKLELSKSIVDYLPVIKEYFIKYYGEDYREVINSRFDNCTYIGYTPFYITKNYLNKLYREKTDELRQRFLLNNNLEVTTDNLDKYFGKYSDFLSKRSINLYKIFECIDDVDHVKYFKDDLIRFLRKFSGNDNLVVNSGAYYSLINELNELRPNFEKIMQEFADFRSKYEKYEEFVGSCEKLTTKIRNKYTVLYLKEIYEFLDEHDKNMADDAYLNGKDINTWNLNCYNILCASFYSNRSLSDSFSSDSEAKLNDPNTKSYTRNSIINDRIWYFNKLGINLGNNFDDYMNDERCLKLRPDVAMVDKIIKIREDLHEKERCEFLTSTTQYQEHLKDIESLNLIDKNISYNYDNVCSDVICINPNIRYKNGKIELYNLLLFSGRCSNDYFDKGLLHECNHLVETELVSVNDNSYVVRSGWDILNCKINDNSDSDEKREFEQLNEIINELLSQEITQVLHSDGIYLFDDKETARIKGGTNYERSRFIVFQFYEEFKEDIKYSRITGDMTVLYNKVGKDNLLELNQLVTDFHDYFSGFTIYKLYEELEKKLDTDRVRFFYKCVSKRDELMVKMKEKELEYISSCSFSK